MCKQLGYQNPSKTTNQELMCCDPVHACMHEQWIPGAPSNVRVPRNEATSVATSCSRICG